VLEHAVATTFRCKIVTPAEAVFDDEVSYVSMPAWDGQQGVMHGQSPLLTKLGIGALKMELERGEERWYLVDGGFAQVHEDVLTILTERATTADAIAIEEAKAELTDANARAVAGGNDRGKVEADQQRAQAKVALAGRNA
jgi:F-type H+-transporting ATPase subunit epsilon